MKIPILNAFKYTVFLLVGLAIVYFLFKDQHNLIYEIQKSHKVWVILSGLSVLIAHFFRALRWRLIIEPLTIKKLSLFNVFNALMLGYLVNLALPRAGELARCAWLSKKEEISTFSLIGTVIAERVFDLLILALIIVLGVTIYADFLFQFFSAFNLRAILLNKASTVLILVVVIVIFSIITFRILKRNLVVLDKIKSFLRKVKSGLFAAKNVKQPYLFGFYTFSIWFFYLLSSYLGFKILDETANLDFSAAILTVIAGSFGMIAPIQGGIGAFHFMVSECLVHLNIPKVPALVYATILHLTQTLTTVIFGLVALVLSINNKKNLKNG